jgi:hypothetical protein
MPSRVRWLLGDVGQVRAYLACLITHRSMCVGVCDTRAGQQCTELVSALCSCGSVRALTECVFRWNASPLTTSGAGARAHASADA